MGYFIDPTRHNEATFYIQLRGCISENKNMIYIRDTVALVPWRFLSIAGLHVRCATTG